MSTDRSSPASRPCRLGLIGVTGYAQAYFEGLNRLVDAGEAEWGAVTIINRAAAVEPVRYFEARGVPIYADYREMLAREGAGLDWMCVPTGIGWHARMTIDSLLRGLPVLVEKPLAPTLQDVAAIQAAEAASGLLVAVGFQHLYLPETWAIKQRLLDGAIGTIERIDSIGLWPRSEAYYERNQWAGRLHDGDSWVLDSPLQNALAHVANLILFFAGATLEGRADPVAIEAELYRSKPIEGFDTIRSEVRLDTGPRAVTILSHSSRAPLDPEIRFVGTKGSFLWRFNGQHTFSVEGRTETVQTRGHVPTRELMFALLLRRLQGDSTVRICSTELAKGTVRWVNAALDATPIHDVPGAFRRSSKDLSGEVFAHLEGLDAVALQAYEERSSFAALDAPWAVPPGSRDLTGYDAFEGRFLAPPVPPLTATVH